jgi:hypothetical protein
MVAVAPARADTEEGVHLARIHIGDLERKRVEQRIHIRGLADAGRAGDRQQPLHRPPLVVPAGSRERQDGR